MNKKIILTLLLGMVLISSVSAWEFDNVKNYDEQNKKVYIQNAFGLGEELFAGKLITQENLPVVRGNDRLVGAFQVEYFNSEGYTLKEIIKNIELLDLKNK